MTFLTASSRTWCKFSTRKTWYRSSNLPQISSKSRSHICTCQLPMNSHSSCKCPWFPTPNLLNLYELPLPIHFNFTTNISITQDVGPTNLLTIGHSQPFQTISSSDLHTCLHLGDTIFCKGTKVMETSLKRSCLGAVTIHGQLQCNSNQLPTRLLKLTIKSLNSQRTLGWCTQ
jgi:hypothetical protein